MIARLALVLAMAAQALAAERPPSVLVIVLDQAAQKAVGAYGNASARTPHIDGLAARGTRFANVYVAAPLCMPSRASLWTSRLPHETGIVSNAPGVAARAELATLGATFAAAGYEAVHYGKEHDAGTLRGFRRVAAAPLEAHAAGPEPIDENGPRDRDTASQAAAFLRGPHARPFLVVADLVNPHDICGWVGRHQEPGEPGTAPASELPPLPDNFELRDLASRPLPIQYLCCSHRRLAQAARWSRLRYRQYLAAYRDYLARADAEVGRLLQAAPAGTIVVLLADHGDGLAAHGHVTKHAAFYEEAVRVPLIVAGPGVPSGRNVEEPLVSTLDLFPTLAALAGIAPPAGLRGQSLAGWLREGAPRASRGHVVSQWHSEYGELVTPGRMLRTPRYKYVRWLEGAGEELYDLLADPGESRTLVRDPEHAAALRAHRELLERELSSTGDPFLKLEVKVAPRWRAHALGYANHRGPSSLDEARAGRR